MRLRQQLLGSWEFGNWEFGVDRYPRVVGKVGYVFQGDWGDGDGMAGLRYCCCCCRCE